MTKVPITFEEEKLNLYIQQILIEFLHVSGKGLGTGYEVVCREGGNMNALSVFLNHSLQDLMTPAAMTARPSPGNPPTLLLTSSFSFAS